MTHIDQLRETMPEPAKDIRLNLQSVLQAATLSIEQRWGVALACAYAARNPRLIEAVRNDAKLEVSAAVLDDAQAAAAIMGMNNVFYRFRHLIGKQVYSDKPARLRMNRLVQPATNKADFELFSLAVSTINGCESCVQSHEKEVVEKGITEDQVHDAVRIAAVIHAAAVVLDFTGADRSIEGGK